MTREAELRKGCGKRLKLKYCGWRYNVLKKRIYCPTCQAELKAITETNAKWKQAVQKFEKRFIDSSAYSYSYSQIKEFIKEIFGGLAE